MWLSWLLRSRDLAPLDNLMSSITKVAEIRDARWERMLVRRELMVADYPKSCAMPDGVTLWTAVTTSVTGNF
jgi:hypothetical protein